MDRESDKRATASRNRTCETSAGLFRFLGVVEGFDEPDLREVNALLRR